MDSVVAETASNLHSRLAVLSDDGRQLLSVVEPEQREPQRGKFAPIVPRLRFNRSRPQVVRDVWRRAFRLCLYIGPCAACGRRCYEFADGENDPRGMLGDHAHMGCEGGDDVEDIPHGVGLVACFECMNVESSYLYLVNTLRRRVKNYAAWANKARQA